MSYILKNDKCTGCAACANVCPKNCIKMLADSEGFFYPEIDKKRCIGCDLCKSVCSVYNKSLKNTDRKKQAYACFSKSENIVKKSSSGGLFFEISKKVIDNNGYVCGAEYDDDFSVRHVMTNKKEFLNRLMKSKYIQSSVNGIYDEIKKALINERQVLFMGTPCQVKGLKLFLKKDYNNLICGEVVCHGVPSYKVLKKYTDYVSNNSQLKYIDFRDKENGWRNYSVKMKFENDIEYNISNSECLFLIGFINNLYLRKSCYQCECKLNSTYADFTLGDLWGADKIVPNIDNNKGISLFISNSDKGDAILKSLSDDIFIKKLENDDYLNFNPSIIKSSEMNIKRKDFFDNFNRFDFGTLWDYVHAKSKLQKIKILIKNKFK